MLFLVLIYSVSANITCYECIDRAVEPILLSEKNCTTCEGDYCYVGDYHYINQRYQSKVGYKQGCLSFPPPDLPLGCRKNPLGNTICFCKSDNCNSKELLKQSQPLIIPTVTCEQSFSFFHPEGNCTAQLCISQNPIKTVDCIDSQFAPYLAQFDIFAFKIDFGLIIFPAYSCFYLNELTTPGTEVCSFNYTWKESPHKIPTTVQCAMGRNDVVKLRQASCYGRMCISGLSESGVEFYGCINQEEAKIKFLTGIYKLDGSQFYICDTSFCNNVTKYNGERRTWFKKIEVDENSGHVPVSSGHSHEPSGETDTEETQLTTISPPSCACPFRDEESDASNMCISIVFTIMITFYVML